MLKLSHFNESNNSTDSKQSIPSKPMIEVGVDEVGRGCLAGRVYAAAVIWPSEMPPEDEMWKLIKDSKKLSEKKRIMLQEYIQKTAIDYSVAWVDEQTIDSINILQASQLAMKKALDGLTVLPEFILVDGNYFSIYCNRDDDWVSHLCVKKGDNVYVSIAAASILAKVARDTYISELVDKHPYLERYGWRKNKSYGTVQHRQAIREYGITPWHRKTFGICARMSQ